MTDDYIKEIYLLAVHARNNGQIRIPVYIFPFRMTDQNMAAYKARYSGNKELISFWDNLMGGEPVVTLVLGLLRPRVESVK